MKTRSRSEGQMRFAFGPELIVDLFAGGGGASEGIKQAFGRDPDIWNNDPENPDFLKRRKMAKNVYASALRDAARDRVGEGA